MRSPGTAYVLLHHYMGEIDGAFRSWGFSRGGTGAISLAIAGAAREAGVEIRTEAPVARIMARNGRATGVVLPNGDEIDAKLVLSSVDPRVTFQKLLASRATCRRSSSRTSRRYKFRGSSGKVNLALDALPDFTCLPGPGAHLRGAISISPAVEYMERAYDDAKYGDFSRRPVHRHGDPVAHRPVGRPARQARDVVLRAVRALQAARGNLGRRSARRSATPSSTRSPSTRPT